MTTRKFVRDVGPTDARYVLIGEAPGTTENKHGRPFIGESGRLLDKMWLKAGLGRSDFYITNVYPYQPKANKIASVPKDELKVWMDKLHQRIAALDDPHILVPAGNTALKALIGHEQIMDRRGYIFTYRDLNGRVLKVLPTLHPASLLYNSKMLGATYRDWQRIAEEGQDKEIRHRKRLHHVARTEDDIAEFFEGLTDAHLLSVDIETNPKHGEMLCVGFAHNAESGFVIPTQQHFWGSKKRLARAIQWIKLILHHPVEKVFQNGIYDKYWFKMKWGFEVRNHLWDTMWMHHALRPTEKHSLDYIASECIPDQPYWKDQGKAGYDQLLIYNGEDCAVTWEACELLRAELVREGMLDFYHQHYTALYQPLFDMCTHGIKVNQPLMRKQANAFAVKILQAQDHLTALNDGVPLYGAKGSLSPAKLKKFLYGKMGLPEQKKRNSKGDRVATTDEITVRRLTLRFPKEMEEVGPLILDTRRNQMLKQAYVPDQIDADGRLRYEISMLPETGRLSGKKHPMDGGTNPQNRDREIRDIFIADEGMVMWEVDLSQAEGRDVLMRTGDRKLVEIARSHPEDFDMHTHNAALIFGVSDAEVTKQQRYLGKVAVHASQRGMQGKTLSDNLLKDGHVYTVEECDNMIQAYMEEHPPITDWMQFIRLFVSNNRYLTNWWGRTIRFEHERLNDDLWRRAYNFLPQSTIAEVINQWGIIPLYDHIRREGLRTRMHIQAHDAIIGSSPVEELYDVLAFTQQTLEQSIGGYDAGTLVIPCEFKVGKNWKGEHEWKRLPSKADLTDIAKEVVK